MILTKKSFLYFKYLTYHMLLKNMAKEFEINDILNAVYNISKIERKKGKIVEPKNDSTDKDDVLTLNKQVKSNKSKILVLDQMIE